MSAASTTDLWCCSCGVRFPPTDALAGPFGTRVHSCTDPFPLRCGPVVSRESFLANMRAAGFSEADFTEHDGLVLE